MNEPALEQAIIRLREILDQEPLAPESAKLPYQERERHSDFREWRKNTEEWKDRIGQWQKGGLTAVRRPDGNSVHARFYGTPVPETEVALLPDGSVSFRPQEGAPYGWTPPLELPSRGQDIAKFQAKNAKRNKHYARWDLKGRAGKLLRERLTRNESLTDKQIELACDFGENAAPAEVQWISLTRDMLDAKALPRLREWTGQEVKPHLQNYNLAALAAQTLGEAARANPGALAWWMARRDEYDDLEERKRSGPDDPMPPWREIPRHPGEIISQVREEFRQAGGRMWKAFASQPADHAAQILKKEGPESAAWIANALELANLPERKPEPPLAKKPEKARTKQGSLLEPGPPEEKAPEPAGKLREQPPKRIKLMMARLSKRTMSPGRQKDITRRSLGMQPQIPPWTKADPERLDAAMTRMAALAFRTSAGAEELERPEKEMKELQDKFNYIADYVFDQPEAAARASSWSGLQKAAEDWHDDASLLIQRLQLQEAIAKAPGFNQEWEAPMEEWTSPSGFTARLLRSPQELLQEAELLMHCVGSVAYASFCHKGFSRIFRLEPQEAGSQRPQSADATTVELAQIEEQEWEIRQHSGYRNRRPTPQERGWAQELLARWKQAKADELLKNLAARKKQ